MSTQADINLYPTEYVRAYCGITRGDTVVHIPDCSDICTLAYNGSGDLVVSGWLLGYAAPTPANLLALTLAQVLQFIGDFYLVPGYIAMAQPYKISTTDLARIRTDPSMVGFVVFDMTSHEPKLWSGNAWLPVGSGALPIDGGTMAGNINMGANAITNVSNVAQTAPSAIASWSSNSVGVAYSANTIRLIPITGFTTTLNPNSDFTVDTSTGQHTYTGATTRCFRVTINFSVTSVAPGNTTTLTHAISKNGSLSINGQRTVTTFIPLGYVSVNSYSLSDIIQLASDETVQLCGMYTATATIDYQAVSYSIAAI